MNKKLAELIEIEPIYKIKFEFYSTIFSNKAKMFIGNVSKEEYFNTWLKFEAEQKGNFVYSIEIFPDFEKLENNALIIKAIQDSEHVLYIAKDCYEIGNGVHDFVDDCYNTPFTIHGESLAEAIYNYLMLYIKRQTRFQLEDGTMGEWVDTSHTLTRERCYYPEAFDEMVKDSKKLIEYLNKTDWSY